MTAEKTSTTQSSSRSSAAGCVVAVRVHCAQTHMPGTERDALIIHCARLYVTRRKSPSRKEVRTTRFVYLSAAAAAAGVCCGRLYRLARNLARPSADRPSSPRPLCAGQPCAPQPNSPKLDNSSRRISHCGEAIISGAFSRGAALFFFCGESSAFFFSTERG